MSASLEERLWSKVKITDGCWEWTGNTSRGYGRISVNNRRRPTTQVAWELTYKKPWPKGMDACHKCDNPPCVRPDHIFPGTARDNARDALRKGRLVIPQTQKGDFCKRGHVLTDDNSIHGTDSRRGGQARRQCLTCRRMRNALHMRGSNPFRRSRRVLILDNPETRTLCSGLVDPRLVDDWNLVTCQHCLKRPETRGRG